MMPGISGTELARQLVRLRPAMRVLLTSGYSQYADYADAPEEDDEPRFAFLPKPYTQHHLALILRDLLDAVA
jgi:DNA-binding LytR/AlgR family response regulator